MARISPLLHAQLFNLCLPLGQLLMVNASSLNSRLSPPGELPRSHITFDVAMHSGRPGSAPCLRVQGELDAELYEDCPGTVALPFSTR
jgi:hypothetical protein